MPIAFMGGIVGKFFYPFAITGGGRRAGVAFVSFTLDPMLSAVVARCRADYMKRAWWGPCCAASIGRWIGCTPLREAARRVLSPRQWTLGTRVPKLNAIRSSEIGVCRALRSLPPPTSPPPTGKLKHHALQRHPRGPHTVDRSGELMLAIPDAASWHPDR